MNALFQGLRNCKDLSKVEKIDKDQNLPYDEEKQIERIQCLSRNEELKDDNSDIVLAEKEKLKNKYIDQYNTDIKRIDDAREAIKLFKPIFSPAGVRNYSLQRLFKDLDSLYGKDGNNVREMRYSDQQDPSEFLDNVLCFVFKENWINLFKYKVITERKCRECPVNFSFLFKNLFLAINKQARLYYICS